MFKNKSVILNYLALFRMDLFGGAHIYYNYEI